MAASLKDKITPITTPPYQVPSVDVTPDPPIFSLVTTFKLPFRIFSTAVWQKRYLGYSFLNNISRTISHCHPS
jgi:hypothetical protein